MIPHDPITPGLAGSPCNIDGEPWPCPMRLAQRRAVKECNALLRDDLYKPDRRAGDGPWVRWTSPLGHSVLLGYGEHGATAKVILAGATEPVCETDQLTVGWLEGAIP